jgi:hypothetical protein
LMAHVGYLWLQHYPRLCRTTITWGLECHWKSACDQHFAWQEGCLKRAETRTNITNLSQVIACYEAEYKTSQEFEGSTPRMTFVDYMPEVARDKAVSARFALASLPTMVKVSHHWTFTRFDDRRPNLLGRDGLTCTGVVCRSHFLPHVPATAATTAHPRIVPTAEAAALDDDGEDIIGAEHAMLASEVGLATTSHLGWRTSYRKSEPEKMSDREENLVGRLQKKADAMRSIHDLLPAAVHAYMPMDDDMKLVAKQRTAARGRTARLQEQSLRLPKE